MVVVAVDTLLLGRRRSNLDHVVFVINLNNVDVTVSVIFNLLAVSLQPVDRWSGSGSGGGGGPVFDRPIKRRAGLGGGWPGQAGAGGCAGRQGRRSRARK